MSSPCLSGGGRSYGFELERVKSSPSAASTATASASAITSSLTSSPSSTLSESSNSPLAISTRKPRTPRKRPNQTYNEAAALLSTVYPNIFSTITNHHKFTTPGGLLLDQPSDLLLSPFPVFDTPGFLLRHQYHYRPIDKPDEPRLTNLTIPSYQSCGEVDSPMGTADSTNSMEVCEEEDDLDTGSILDEEIGEGIDSIMGNLSVGNEMAASGGGGGGELNSWRSMGYNFGGKFQPGIRAFRNLEERNWWCFPIVDMVQISPRLSSSSSNNGEQEKEKEKEKNSTRNSNSNSNPKLKAEPDASEKRKKKKKKKVVAELAEEVEEVGKNWSAAAQADKQSLLLKLNYKEVLDAWSDRGSPYSDQGLGSDGKDASARLALIDLLSEGGGMREASVLRYKEKRRTRLFSKKIRYQVRKVNADRRPRMKGRFVRRLSSSSSGQPKKREIKMLPSFEHPTF